MYANNVVSIQRDDVAGDEREPILASNETSPMKFDLSAARIFLRLLDPNASEFSFQTFDGKKQKRQHLVRQYHASLKSVADELKDLNKAGAGVYVTVQRTDLEGRKGDNIIGIRAIFADFDDGLPDDLPLKPSIVVRSSPGKFQCYWFCHKLTKPEFEQVMERLVQDYGADSNAKDLARVLRVPGFYHNKGEPYLVKIVDTILASYTRQAILEAFPPVDASGATKDPPEPATNPPKSADNLLDALGHVPADDYGIWLNVGCALHHETSGSAEGYKLWEDWSAKAPEKFSVEACQQKWASFNSRRHDPVTVGTIFYHARQNGWNGSTQQVVWPELLRDGSPVKRSQRNITAALDHLGIQPSYDEFSYRYFVDGLGATRRELDEMTMRELFLEVDALGLKCTKDYFYDVICKLAEKNSSHVVRKYLHDIEWDGTPRLERLLIEYCGAEDTDFNRTVGRTVLVAAVRRIRQPGVKFDNVLVLEGHQGAGKSSFARILAGDDWFTDCVRIGDEPKIIAEQTRGILIVELAELAGLSKRDLGAVKSMVSCQFDIARMAYQQTTSRFPRQFIFIGTTNSQEYLIDGTGNRRFWPVQVQKIDLVALARDRDQLWAEAAYHEAKGESIVLPEELWTEAEKVQSSRRLVDSQEEYLIDLISDLHGIIPQEEIFAALGVGGDRVSCRKHHQSDIVKRTMKTLGWSKTRRRKLDRFDGSKNGRDNRMQVYERQIDEGSNNQTWWRFDADQKCFVEDKSVDVALGHNNKFHDINWGNFS